MEARIVKIIAALLCIASTLFSRGYGDMNTRCKDNERIVLLKFKKELFDPSNRLSSLVGPDCCKWEGIGCNNRTGHVRSLQLRNQAPIEDITTDQTILRV